MLLQNENEKIFTPLVEKSETVNRTIRDQNATPKFKVNMIEVTEVESNDYDSNAIYDSEYDEELDYDEESHDDHVDADEEDVNN